MAAQKKKEEMMDGKPAVGMVEQPQLAFAVKQDGNNKPFISLVVMTSSTVFESLLCTVETFELTQRQLNKQLLDAGKEMRQKASGLVVAQAIPDGLINGGNHVRPEKR